MFTKKKLCVDGFVYDNRNIHIPVSETYRTDNQLSMLIRILGHAHTVFSLSAGLSYPVFSPSDLTECLI